MANQLLELVNFAISLKMMELEALMAKKAQLEAQIPKQTENKEIKVE